MNCTSEEPQRLRAARPRRSRTRAGFTLVEMMVAVVILSVGLLGLVSAGAFTTRQVGGGAKQMIAAQVIANRLEKFRSLGCSKIVDSTETTRGVTESWVRGAMVNRVLYVVDTVKYSIPGGHPRTQTYTITVQCR